MSSTKKIQELIGELITLTCEHESCDYSEGDVRIDMVTQMVDACLNEIGHVHNERNSLRLPSI